jgi:hypothetical protein
LWDDELEEPFFCSAAAVTGCIGLQLIMPTAVWCDTFELPRWYPWWLPLFVGLAAPPVLALTAPPELGRLPLRPPVPARVLSRGWALSFGGALRGTCLNRERDLSAEKTRLRRLDGEAALEAPTLVGLAMGVLSGSGCLVPLLIPLLVV